MLRNELELFQKKVNALKIKLEAASDEKEYKDIRLSFDYNQLQIEKLQKKIEEAEQQKADIEAELNEMDKQIEILNCILDHYQLLKDIENWEDRKVRTLERIRKTLEDRDGFYTLRTNLNLRWQKLIADPEPEKKRISIFSQDKPKKPEELCQPLTLKADAENYFI